MCLSIHDILFFIFERMLQEKTRSLFEKITEELALVEKGEIELLTFYNQFWNNAVLLPPDQHKVILARLKKISNESDQAKCWYIFSEGCSSTFYPSLGNVFEQLSESIESFRRINDKPGEGAAQTMISLYFKNIGELDRALEYLQNSILNINGNETYRMFHAIAYYQLGEIHQLMKEYDAAIDFYNKGLPLTVSLTDTSSRLLNALGTVYRDKNQLELAFEYYQKALKQIETRNNHLLESKIIADIGNYFFKKGDYEQAMEYQTKSIKIRKEQNFGNALITNYLEIAELLLEQKKHAEALEYALMAEKLAKELNVVIKLYKAYHVISVIYEATDDTALSLVYYKKFHQSNDEVLHQENARKIKQLNMLHEMQSVQKEKEMIQLKNVVLKSALDELEASVRYARRIQTAILPSNTAIKACLPDSFIFYKPKDVVAGDFYWMEKTKEGIIFAVADCTGHGVPGAIVSVICSNALNRSVNEYYLSDPGQILNKTCQLVLEQFEKSEDQVNDGMDISLCTLDPKNKTLLWCGANNPLWIIRRGELLTSAPNKRPIGKHINTSPFTSQRIELQNNDLIYIFSDGYKDQFGGELGKKFKSSALQKLILSIREKSMEEQGNILEQTFENWKGDFEQIDDVCVMGVKWTGIETEPIFSYKKD